MSKSKSVVLPLAAVVALSSMSAVADDISFYVGAGVGGSRIEQDLNLKVSAFQWVPPGPDAQFTEFATTTLSTFEGTDVGFRAFGGIRLGQYLGIEAGYVNLGDQTDAADLNMPPFPLPPSAPQRPETDISVVVDNDVHGLDAYAVGYLPFSEKVEGFVKLGFLYWDSTVKIKNQYSDTFPPSGPDASFPAFPTVTPPSSTTDFDGTDVAGGIGVNYKATESMILRAEGTWYDIEDTKQAYLIGLNIIVPF